MKITTENLKLFELGMEMISKCWNPLIRQMQYLEDEEISNAWREFERSMNKLSGLIQEKSLYLSEPMSFHQAWGQAKERDDYNKPSWTKAEKTCEGQYHTFEEWLTIVYFKD